MAGYDINSINALGSDPMFLAALNAYNPNFMRTQQASQMQQVATNPQVASTTPQQAALTQTTELPKADYSQEADSNTGLVAGLTVTALGAASLIYAAKKGNGEGIIKGFKNIFKGVVVFLAYRIFCREPKILFCINRKLETGMRKRPYRRILIILTLNNSRAFEIIYCFSKALSVFACKHELRFALAGNSVFRRLIYVAVCVTGNRNGLLPIFNSGLNKIHNYGSTENRAV